MADLLQTEEATKTALVMPFINALGYDVFNPTEVIPEFIADVGIKKGEKVDYAIQRDGKLAILFECKPVGTDLDRIQPTQLYRYFSVTDARFAVLTNGIEYRFFSDLESPNKMDERAFFEFDLFEISEKTVEELKKFSKDAFDLDNILSTASHLKYTKGIKRVLSEEWVNPSDDFVKLLAARVYGGRFTQAVVEQFTLIAKQALQEFVSDHVNRRLKSALDSESMRASVPGTDMVASDRATPENSNESVETTEEELEGFFIVKSVLREVVDPARVFMRDTLSYCGVLLDDNNRKPICRLFFNRTSKYVGLFDKEKKVTRHTIENLNDIYKFAEHLKQTVIRYDTGQTDETSPVEITPQESTLA